MKTFIRIYTGLFCENIQKSETFEIGLQKKKETVILLHIKRVFVHKFIKDSHYVEKILTYVWYLYPQQRGLLKETVLEHL